MKKPDQRAFETDVEDADFQIGVVKGMWGLADTALLPDRLVWPQVVLWVAAAERPNSPDRFYLLLNLENYRSAAPTGAFWNARKKEPLAPDQWPKGKSGSRVAKVFRTDWKNCVALYHPYDRVATSDHRQWLTEQPHLIWDSKHTIVDYLNEIHWLLNSGDYTGA